MAFKTKDLSVLHYARGFTLWHYETKDTLKDMMSGHYFDSTKYINNNDAMVINAGDGNYTVFVKKDPNDNTITLTPTNLNWMR